MGWAKLDEKIKEHWGKALEIHEKNNPQPVIKTLNGDPVEEGYTPRMGNSPVEQDDSSHIPQT